MCVVSHHQTNTPEEMKGAKLITADRLPLASGFRRHGDTRRLTAVGLVEGRSCTCEGLCNLLFLKMHIDRMALPNIVNIVLGAASD